MQALKFCLHYIASLHSIFTRVWEDEVIPEEWHKGIIIPLHKGKRTRLDCSNYRRVCTCHTSKNQTKLTGTWTFSAERCHPWPTHLRSHSNFIQHCTMTARLLCWSVCVLPLIPSAVQCFMVTARDSRQDIVTLIKARTATLLAAFLRVLGSQLNLEFTKGVCWHQTLSPRTWVDWLLERTVGSAMNGVSFGSHFLRPGLCRWCRAVPSYLNSVYLYRDDHIRGRVSRAWGELAEVQALGSREDKPSTITAQGQEVAVVEEFVYLGSLIHPTTRSSPDISRRNAITHAAKQNLDSQIWKLRISIIPNWSCIACVLPIFLYGS